MLYVRQNATHKVVIGPVVAVGDGFTPVTTLSLASADEKCAILHDNGTVVSISGYTFAAITSADGYYHLTLQSGISGTVGHVTIVINDDSLCLPVKADFTVVEEAVYDMLFAASATGYIANQPVDVNTIKTQTVTCAAGVTVNTNVGTTQPINFTGTGSSALAKIDVIDWVGTTVPAPNQTGVPKVDVTFAAGEIISTDNAGAFVVKLADAAHGGSSATLTLDALVLTSGFEPTTNNAIAAAVVTAFSDDTGTAQAGASGTITLQSGASATNSYYNGAVVCLTGGTGAGQSRKITGYVGSTKVATIDSNWATNPDNTSTYFVIGRIA